MFPAQFHVVYSTHVKLTALSGTLLFAATTGTKLITIHRAV